MFRRAVVTGQGRDLEDGISKIIVIEEKGGLNDVELLSGMIHVDVKACCINYPDLMQTTNSYQHKVKYPYTPGFEIGGVVRRVGSRCQKFKIGDRIVAWTVATAGGLSTEMIVDQDMCIPLPRGYTFAQGAAFRMGYETAFHSLVERGNISPADVVLVNGATGGMGFAAVQLAKKVFGCTVIATGGSDEKLAVVKDVGGADYVINYTSNPNFSKAVKDLTGGKGVTLVFDPVGGAVFDQGLRSTAFGARILIVGFTSKSHPKIRQTMLSSSACLSLGVGLVKCQLGWKRRRDKSSSERVSRVLTLLPKVDYWYLIFLKHSL